MNKPRNQIAKYHTKCMWFPLLMRGFRGWESVWLWQATGELGGCSDFGNCDRFV